MTKLIDKNWDIVTEDDKISELIVNEYSVRESVSDVTSLNIQCDEYEKDFYNTFPDYTIPNGVKNVDLQQSLFRNVFTNPFLNYLLLHL